MGVQQPAEGDLFSQHPSKSSRFAAAKGGRKHTAMTILEAFGVLTTRALPQTLQIPADGFRARGLGDDDAADCAQEGVSLDLSSCTSIA